MLIVVYFDYHLYIYILFRAEGIWESDVKLEIIIDEEYYNSLLEAHAAKRVISVTPRLKSETDMQQTAKFRPSTVGVFRVFALNMDTRKIASKMHEIRVDDCGDYVLPTPNYASAERQHNIPRPTFRLSGVAAINGVDPISVPNIYVSSSS